MIKTKKIMLCIIALIMLAFTIQQAIAVIVTGQGSSYTFYVDNCTSPQINQTFNCSSAIIRYQCDFSPVAFINNVDFRIQGNDYTTTQNSTNPNQFYYNYNKPAEGSNDLNPIVLDRERITDVNNKKVNAYEYVAIQHNCTTCPANTTKTILQPCQTTNNQLVQYTSSNETCIPSYNTTENCNYCNADIIENITECFNGTQTITYTDANYFSCCYATGLMEDCFIQQYPYNTTTTQNCEEYTKEFTCTLDTKPILNTKININCVLPSNEEYCCVINTLQGNNLLATSPEYKKPSNLNPFGGDTEERNCFLTTNKLLNAYYTTKELRPSTEYDIQVLCTSANTSTSTKYETPISPVYHTPDWLPYRLQQIGQNPVLTITTIIVIILLILIGIVLWRKIRG
jgi:hypothetical protein